MPILKIKMDAVRAWFRQASVAERNQALRSVLDELPFDALPAVKGYIGMAV